MIWATKWLLFCSLAPLVSSRSILEAFTKIFSKRNNDLTLSMMDEIVQYMTGTGVFDRDMYNDIKQCIENTDSNAFALQSKIWEKMIAFWESRGLPEDVWGTFDYGYLENNKTTGSFSGMEFIEPCNCASNIAYYRTLLELCDKQNKLELKCIYSDVINPFIKAAGYLVASSYFHHASKTRVGLSLVQRIIGTMGPWHSSCTRKRCQVFPTTLIFTISLQRPGNIELLELSILSKIFTKLTILANGRRSWTRWTCLPISKS